MTAGTTATTTTKSFVNPPPGVKCIASLQDTIFAKSVFCSQESGYSFWVISAAPDVNEITSMCQSGSCQTMIDNMRRVAPAECVMYQGFYLYQDILNPILKQCTVNGAWIYKAPAPATGSPFTTTRTPAPAKQETSSSSSSSTATTVSIVGTTIVVLSVLVWLVKSWRKQKTDNDVPVAQVVDYRGMKNDRDSDA